MAVFGGVPMKMGEQMANEALEAVGFGGEPSVLILADTDAGIVRGARSAELSGCRILAVEGIEAGLKRLQRQAAVDVVFLDLERDHASLDQILVSLKAGAEDGRYGSVVSAPLPLIDTVVTLAWHQRVELLSSADEADRVLALARAAARPRQWLNDIGNEQTVPRLQQISDEVRRIAAALDDISTVATRDEHQSARGEGKGKSMDAGAVRAIIRARRLRDQFFGSDLFADPAWDILLDLYAARLEKQRVAVSSLCIAAAVPATTALRWIKTLTDMGLLVRAADPQDGRRVYIELAPQAAEGLQAYLGAAQRISPLNL
jgi:DNA-binding MarR family transcriptional regulator/CheY-like chemotaxis protein